MFFKKRIIKTGAIPDIKDIRDFRFEEIGKVAVVDWQEKTDWKTYESFDQNGSSSCVANAVSKMLGIENMKEEGKFIHFSPRDIYTRRTNKPGEGMSFREAMEIGSKYGATLEQLMPSQGLSETIMNSAEDRKPFDEIIAKIGRGGNYVALPCDINAIATILLRGKGVLLGFTFDYSEWDRVVPVINGTPKYCHAVCATDFGLLNGKKVIAIDESWGLKNIKQRFLTEDWFAKRCVASWYFEDLSNKEAIGITQKYQFLFDLDLEMENGDVVKLQEILKALGFFPKDQNCTGYYGGITAKAVLDFQLKYGIVASKDEPGAGRFGPKTREKLNSLQ